MNKALLETLIKWPKPYITGIDLMIHLDNTKEARKAIVKRAAQEGYLQRLKQNLYLIQKLYQKSPVDTFEVAQLIWGPSYISYESSLSYHNWIPEAVHVISSSCFKKSNTFLTFLGVFSYEKVPQTAFPIGVYSCHQGEVRYLIAYPWKAVADMIYSRNKNWINSQSLAEDLRIEMETLQNSDLKLLEHLIENYPNKRTQKVLLQLFRSL